MVTASFLKRASTSTQKTHVKMKNVIKLDVQPDTQGCVNIFKSFVSANLALAAPTSMSVILQVVIYQTQFKSCKKNSSI